MFIVFSVFVYSLLIDAFAFAYESLTPSQLRWCLLNCPPGKNDVNFIPIDITDWHEKNDYTSRDPTWHARMSRHDQDEVYGCAQGHHSIFRKEDVINPQLMIGTQHPTKIIDGYSIYAKKQRECQPHYCLKRRLCLRHCVRYFYTLE